MKPILKLPKEIIAIMIICMALLVPAVALAKAGAVFTVLVKSTKLRKSKQFFGPPVTTVTFGMKVTEVSRDGAWYFVNAPTGERGWIHETAITEKDVDIASANAGAKSGVSSEEVALAGKGFNPEVEKEYSTKHPELNYAKVDAIAAQTASDKEMESFLRSGQLTPFTKE